MQRKIIKQGASTLTTSLPAEWIKDQKIKHGDTINIQQINNKLIIEKTKKQTTPLIKFTENNKTFIRTTIINFYCRGYNKIKIQFANTEIYLVIRETITNYLIGFDITEKNNNSCTIENLTEPGIKQFENIFKKVLFNTTLLINETEHRLENKTSFKEHREIITKIHQYENFCKRLIAKKYPLGENTLPFWGFLAHTVQAAKEVSHLNKFIDKNKITIKNTTYTKLKKYITLIQEAYIKKDIKILELLHKYHAKHIKASDFDKILKTSAKENVINYHAIVAIRHLYLASNSLLGMIIQ